MDWARLGSMVDLPLRRAVDGRGNGARRSLRTGVGFDIAGVRTYREGDEVRRIDWAATARTGELHVRTTSAESGVRTLVALDLTTSMQFGTSAWKADVAADLTYLIGHAAARRGDQVAVATSGTGTSPSASGSRAQHLLTAAIEGASPSSTDELAVQLIAGTRPSVPTGLVVIVTDLFTSLFTTHSDVVARVGSRHELVVIVIHDPAELELPEIDARFIFRFPGSTNTVTAELGDRSLRDGYRREVQQHRLNIETVVHAAGGQLVEISTDGDPISAAIDAFSSLDGSGVRR